MPTRKVNLTPELDAFVEEMVRAGKYESASEAMRDAVRGKAGTAALDRGEFTEVAEADLDAYLDDQ